MSDIVSANGNQVSVGGCLCGAVMYQVCAGK